MEKFHSSVWDADVNCHLIVNLLTVNILPKLVEKGQQHHQLAVPTAVEQQRINLHNKKNVNINNRLANKLAANRHIPGLPDSTFANYQQLQRRQHVLVHIPIRASLTST